MSNWTWLIAYGDGDARVVLADRDTVGGICESIGSAALDLSAYSWPWWIGLSPHGRLNLGSLLYDLGHALLKVADSHTTTFYEIPAEGDLAAALERHQLIDREAE